MNKNTTNLPAVVLGMGLTGLSITRSLGRKGIPVWGLDSSKSIIGFYSCYCKGLLCPEPCGSANDLLRFMVRFGKTATQRAVLIPTSDEFVLFVSRHREILANYFRFLLPDKDITDRINDKRSFYELAKRFGIPYPKTHFPETLDNIKRIAAEINYPCIIKPAFSYLYNDRFTKVLKVGTPQELEYNYRLNVVFPQDTIIQEVVSGRDHYQYSVGSYLNSRSEPVAVFVSNKVRQRPAEFGVGTFFESCNLSHLADMSVSFLQALKYKGLSEIEYKLDAGDGQFKIIETNTRPWIQIGHAYPLGIDFPAIAYRELAGFQVGRSSTTQRFAKWINFEHDFYATFGRGGYVSRNELGIREWLTSLNGRKTYAIFACDDARPFIISVLRWFRRILTTFSRSVRNRKTD